MLVSDVVNAASTDMRQVLSNTGADANIIVGWVDRIHKEVLHTTLYSVFNRFTTTINVVAGTSSYALAPTPAVRRILTVYDRTFDRTLLPLDELGNPSPKDDTTQGPGLQMPKAVFSNETNAQWPEYYQRIGQTLILFPAPTKTAFNSTYEIYYEGTVATLASLSTNLVVPDDGLDIMVAGVNSLAAAYLKNPEDYQAYKGQFEALKQATFNG